MRKVDGLLSGLVGLGATTATISMTIANHGTSPIALNYVPKQTNFVSELGYGWHYTCSTCMPYSEIHGLPIESAQRASINTIITPGSELNVTITLSPDVLLSDVLDVSNAYDFQTGFSSYIDMGQGHLKKLRNYTVSFIGLHKSSVQENLQQDLKQGVKDFGDGLKKAFGGFFGK